MRLKARTDANHKEIAEAFCKAGWLVLSLAPMGDGVPDLLISRHGQMRLVEVKAKRGKLTSYQEEFRRAGWHFDVVRDVDDVLAITRGVAKMEAIRAVMG